MPIQTMLVAPNDGKYLSTAFAYGPAAGGGIIWIPHAEARDAGLFLKWWQWDPATVDPKTGKGDYYRNFSQAQIQALINTCWRGGSAMPAGFAAPT